MALPLLGSQKAEQAESSADIPSRLTAPRILALWHLASFDAPCVAVVWTMAIAWVAGVRLDPRIAVMIACGTWTVYVLDRLLDAHRAIGAGNLNHLRERHYFHWRHRRGFLMISGCTAAIAAVLVIRLLPVSVREHDSVIAAAALVYFSGVHSRFTLPAWCRRFASKEFIVGVIFTAGCAAPTLSCLHATRTGTPGLWPALMCVVVLATVAWLNCTTIECWESNFDCPGIPSPAAPIFMIGSAAALALWLAQPRALALICAGLASALLLLLLNGRRHHIAPVTLRALADLVLLTPAFLLIFGARG